MTSPPTLVEALGADVVTLDGGLATELENRGHDLSSDLWSARLLAEDPAEIRAVHAAYLAAGARVVTTASYQASYEGLAAAGLDDGHADLLIARSVELARSAADEAAALAEDGSVRWVAASVGPYGAMLAGGQEYTGDYGPDMDVAQLRDWHRRRLQVLVAAGPDVLALETVPNLAEAEALLMEVADLGTPVWLSLTCDGGRTRAGEDPTEAFAMARDVDAVVAVGVNCTRPGDVAALVRVASRTSGKPVVVYPNSGEDWDADARVWTGDPTFAPDAVTEWVRQGARLVGGCCRVGPREVARLDGLLHGAGAGGGSASTAARSSRRVVR